MKVRELIAILSMYGEDSEVILQKDSEGNGYSPLCGAGLGYYVSENSYSGEFYDVDWSADDCCMDEEDWNNMRSGEKSVILFPIN